MLLLLLAVVVELLLLRLLLLAVDVESELKAVGPFGAAVPACVLGWVAVRCCLMWSCWVLSTGGEVLGSYFLRGTPSGIVSTSPGCVNDTKAALLLLLLLLLWVVVCSPPSFAVGFVGVSGGLWYCCCCRVIEQAPSLWLALV